MSGPCLYRLFAADRVWALLVDVSKDLATDLWEESACYPCLRSFDACWHHHDPRHGDMGPFLLNHRPYIGQDRKRK